jgi:ubiquinone/menaquinone biosynthesis C-methylase UbiE
MSSDRNRHTETVREQFRIQSAQLDQQIGGQGNQAIGPWVLENLGLNGSESVLDVATGTGLMARDLAPHVAHITGIDVTLKILAQARRITADSGIANLTFDDGNATALPYPDDRFDVVISRIAVHHFENPEVELREMRRVCKPHGRVVIVDITASDDPSIADAQNRSHTTAFCPSDLRALLKLLGAQCQAHQRKPCGS